MPILESTPILKRSERNRTLNHHTVDFNSLKQPQEGEGNIKCSNLKKIITKININL